MAITATIDSNVNPITLTVVSDKRVLSIDGTATAAGESAEYHAQIISPVNITDSESHVWTLVSDDDRTAVYSY